MANRERGEMTLAALGQSYILRLTTNACCELEDRTGRLLDDIVRGIYRRSIRDLRWLLWACLQDRHAEAVKTPEDAGRVIDDAGGVDGVVAQMLAFMTLNADQTAQADRKSERAADPPIAQGETAGVDSTSMPVSVA